MEVTTRQEALEGAGHTLHLERTLLPIDEYAAREGVSREIVEKCGQLGIVQIRRYKGKTFVVDIPLGPYSCVSEAIKEAGEPVDRVAQARKISELAQKIIPGDSIAVADHRMQDHQVQEAIERRTGTEEAVEAGAISELVKRMSRRATKPFEASAEKIDGDIGRVEEMPGSVQVVRAETPKSSVQSTQLTGESNGAKNLFELTEIQQRGTAGIVDKPTAPTGESRRTEILSEPIQPPDWEIFENPDGFPELSEEDMETEEEAEPVQIPEDNKAETGTFSPRAESNHNWQVAVIFLIIFFVAAMFGNVWFYVDNQVQLGKLDLIYADIQKTHQEAAQANERVDSLKSELAESRAEVRRFRRELDRTGAEVQNVEGELTRARQNLQRIHRINAEAIERFNKQIEKLVTMTE
ncbi:MAG: hypothetical protein ACYSSO_03785 [Planctomycetota bacterium]|jgi:hypothetical protein